MKKLLIIFLMLMPSLVLASESVPLDKAPIDPNNQASLQRGAKVFVNYCLNCHSAAYMRFNRLQDIGLTEKQIKDNLLVGTDKVGDQMKIALTKKDAKEWFGVAPPDLTVVARSRSADWLYTYLRGFYADSARPTGWNNVAFANVGMPHVLWELQGEQVLKTEKHEGGHETHTLTLNKSGKLSPAEYDATIADLVNYLVYMSEPAQNQRKHLGVIVLLFLGLLFVASYYLKKEFWKDIH
jgi:ubiquinol-cytochrome c reductase cytochrome c1 subunit